MTFDFDSPGWPATLLIGLILGFLIYVMMDSITPEQITPATLPPPVYVVETLP